jgi:mannose-6-phosphate isomerase
VVRPFLLAADAFTSTARTPWGGRRIAQVLKSGWVDPDRLIGESWELSFGPEFPSRLDGDRRTLADLIRAAPEAMLGREVARGGTALLVKLIDAREALSVQVHPRDDDPALASDESGKPESWYVEHAEPGAGIWIGLAEGTTRDAMERAIRRGADVSALLLFVPVEPGDFFLVDPGIPHAIGAGVTLVEVQRVLPGRRGATYRYWDWNRRYDAEGRIDPKGSPRALHLERALAVTDWDRARGEGFLSQIRRRAGPAERGNAFRIEVLASPEGPLRSPSLEVARITGRGRGVLPPLDALRAITVLEGMLRVAEVTIDRGRTAALPPSPAPVPIEADHAHAIVSAVH